MFLSIASEAWAIIAEMVTGAVDAITSAIEGIIPIFWDDLTSSFTFVGVMALFGIGLALVMVGLTFIRRLVRR